MAYEVDRGIIAVAQASDERVRQKVLDYLKAKWFGQGSWREADIQLLVAEARAVVDIGKKQVSGLTVAYLDSLVQAAGLGRPPYAAIDLSDQSLRGVDPDELYRRSGITVWTALSKGKDIKEAARLGWLRLEETAETGMQLAHTHTARAWMERSPHVVGYRRVVRGSSTCALCYLASTQRYHKAALEPIHTRCHCKVVPIIGTHDPGQLIDEERYTALHSALRDQYPDAFTSKGWESSNKPNSHIRIHEHGETGPTLTWAGHGFTGPGDI